MYTTYLCVYIYSIIIYYPSLIPSCDIEDVASLYLKSIFIHFYRKTINRANLNTIQNTFVIFSLERNQENDLGGIFVLKKKYNFDVKHTLIGSPKNFKRSRFSYIEFDVLKLIFMKYVTVKAL